MGEHEKQGTSFLVVDENLYKKLRFLAQVLLPALAAAYVSLAGVWGLPYVEEVVSTITILNTLLGVLVRAMRKAYENLPTDYDGAVNVLDDPDPENPNNNLHIQIDPNKVEEKGELVLKVNK